MKKGKLKIVEKTVEKILEKDMLARKDDCYLILKVIQEMYPDLTGSTFAFVMFNAKRIGISFESITRARRKVQSKYSELKDMETANIRNEEQKEYIEYSREE